MNYVLASFFSIQEEYLILIMISSCRSEGVGHIS